MDSAFGFLLKSIEMVEINTDTITLFDPAFKLDTINISLKPL